MPASSESKGSTDPLKRLLRSAAGLLALQELPGVGPTTALRAALLTTNFDALLELHAHRWEQALENAYSELERCAERDVLPLTVFDDEYPARLRSLHDPPPLLFLHGSREALGATRSVAVVGTRKPTSFGCSATEHLVAALAKTSWVIVSGLAKGIDTLAHGGALKRRTPTVAVLAGGLDRIYPAENRELAAAIVDRGGALVSEQRWRERPQRSSFVRRNRIQTGLAAAVVITQTGKVGGTMHTARHAAAQGRPIFCPVPRSRHEKSEGLDVLLNAPASKLCELLPAWRDAAELCARLGDAPLACPIAKDEIDDFLNALEFTLTAEPQTVAQPRWWPALDPPARLGDRDVVAADDRQAPLFA